MCTPILGTEPSVSHMLIKPTTTTPAPKLYIFLKIVVFVCSLGVVLCVPVWVLFVLAFVMLLAESHYIDWASLELSM